MMWTLIDITEFQGLYIPISFVGGPGVAALPVVPACQGLSILTSFAGGPGGAALPDALPDALPFRP
jgi:hypothetical protein